MLHITEKDIVVSAKDIELWVYNKDLSDKLNLLLDETKLSDSESCMTALENVKKLNEEINSTTLSADLKYNIIQRVECFEEKAKAKYMEFERNKGNRCADWFPVGTKFLAELEFDVENEDSAFQIIKSYLKGTYILPNLKVKGFYARNCSVDHIISCENHEKLEELKEKWKNIVEDYNKELEDFLDNAGYKEIKPQIN